MYIGWSPFLWHHSIYFRLPIKKGGKKTHKLSIHFTVASQFPLPFGWWWWWWLLTFCTSISQVLHQHKAENYRALMKKQNNRPPKRSATAPVRRPPTISTTRTSEWAAILAMESRRDKVSTRKNLRITRKQEINKLNPIQSIEPTNLIAPKTKIWQPYFVLLIHFNKNIVFLIKKYIWQI